MPTISDVRVIGLIYDEDTLSYIPWDGTLNAGSVVVGSVTQSGVWTARLQQGSSAVRTSVADTASDTVLLAANALRIVARVTNTSSARLYLALGSDAATTSNYTAWLNQGDMFEEPYYTGVIRGIWASDPGDGAALVTEIT